MHIHIDTNINVNLDMNIRVDIHMHTAFFDMDCIIDISTLISILM